MSLKYTAKTGVFGAKTLAFVVRSKQAEAMVMGFKANVMLNVSGIAVFFNLGNSLKYVDLSNTLYT